LSAVPDIRIGIRQAATSDFADIRTSAAVNQLSSRTLLPVWSGCDIRNAYGSAKEIQWVEIWADIAAGDCVTSDWIASLIWAPDDSNSFVGPPTIVVAGRLDWKRLANAATFLSGAFLNRGL
jgi:hypothetical protein